MIETGNHIAQAVGDKFTVATALADIIKKIHAYGEREIASKQLGEWVMDELKKMDQVAYVRFASVYRSFQDLDEFRKEIEKLITH